MSHQCIGQQKNAIFATMCLEVIENHPSIYTIDHRFFKTDNSQMKCDSMHLIIVKAREESFFTR